MINNTVELNQQLAQDGIDQNFNSRSFGDELSRNKRKEIIRIGYQNVKGFGYSMTDTKTERIRNFIVEKKLDSMLMVEINTNWRLINQHNLLQSIAKRWFERSKTTNSFNVHRKSRLPCLPGGTAIISNGSLSYRIQKGELDERRMGRWASQLINGKNNLKTRLVTVYVPKNPYQPGERKIFNQQKVDLHNKFANFCTLVFHTI